MKFSEYMPELTVSSSSLRSLTVVLADPKSKTGEEDWKELMEMCVVKWQHW